MLSLIAANVQELTRHSSMLKSQLLIKLAELGHEMFPAGV